MRKSNYFLIIALVFFVFVLTACPVKENPSEPGVDPTPVPAPKSYGTATGHETVDDIIENSGYYAMAGQASNTESAGQSDFYLLCVDSGGNEQFHALVGTDGDEEASALDKATGGGYIMAGYRMPAGSLNTDLYLVKTDASGNTYPSGFALSFDEGYTDAATDVIETSDGGFLAAGTTEDGAGDRDVYFVKTDASGNTHSSGFISIIGVSGDEAAWSVAEAPGGGYIAAGWRDTTGSNDDVFLMKITGGGNEEWTKTYGGANNDVGQCVFPTSDNGYVITGYTESEGEGGQDLWIIKTDGAGNIQWDVTYGTALNEGGIDIKELPGGGYIVTGYSQYDAGDPNDLYLIKTDSSGNTTNGGWIKTFGKASTDEKGCGVIEDSGSFAAAGHTENSGFGDAYLVKTDSSGVITWE